MRLSDKVRSILGERALTQQNLATTSGLDATVLCRLLGGSRDWRMEHVASIAAALAMTPDALLDGTDFQIPIVKTIDAAFVERLVKAHNRLASENARLEAEVEALRMKSRASDERIEKLDRENAELMAAHESDNRTVKMLDSQLKAAERRVAVLSSELSATKNDLDSMRYKLEAERSQAVAARAAHLQALDVANRNYSIAKELERKLEVSLGVAAATSIFGVAMLAGSVIADSNESAGTPRRRWKSTGANRRKKS